MLRRVALGLPLVAIFAVSTYSSWEYAYSDTFLQSASRTVLLERRNQEPSLTQITLARAYTEEALALTPEDPDTLDLAGRISYLEATSSAPDTEQEALLHEAVDFHTKALEHRRYWPYSHLNIVFAKSSLGEFDSEYNQHFELAYELGFDDRSVTRDLVHLGVHDWNEIGQPLRNLTVTLAERALRQNIISPNSLRPYFESTNHLLRFCAHLSQFQEKAELCNS